jgi:hypothetical protein
MRMVMLVAVGMIASMVVVPCLSIALAAKHEKPDYRKSEKNLHHSFVTCVLATLHRLADRILQARSLVPAARRAVRGAACVADNTREFVRQIDSRFAQLLRQRKPSSGVVPESTDFLSPCGGFRRSVKIV